MYALVHELICQKREYRATTQCAWETVFLEMPI